MHKFLDKTQMLQKTKTYEWEWGNHFRSSKHCMVQTEQICYRNGPLSAKDYVSLLGQLKTEFWCCGFGVSTVCN